jgi:hypothetical protein
MSKLRNIKERVYKWLQKILEGGDGAYDTMY